MQKASNDGANSKCDENGGCCTICTRDNVRSAASVGDFQGFAKKFEALR